MLESYTQQVVRETAVPK